MKQPEGNFYNKYETKNPLAKILMSNFTNSFFELINSITVKTIFEAGCGEGYMTNLLAEKTNASIIASDISEKVINEARLRVIGIGAEFEISSIYSIDHPDNAFDLVIACEVLEHLDNPLVALKELKRVSDKYIIVSVPREPIWRVLNIARGKYIHDLGNTPGHIQHWSMRNFKKFIEAELKIVSVKMPLPWTMFLCEK
ncbi:MAG: class I SAM-dependent methyltransferase [Syntrophomonadaceae bacterium]|jgi:2-polyprenyl-3-methyl-5-hydroxy-6-metoxy-1,4-benzoquinol methylase|nr:class I SAM-dependent methyltransferase [Syntrophomonadaceae bacterium]